MMNWVFGGMLLFSFFLAACTGRMEPLSQAALEQAGTAVALVVSLTGMLCLWSGMMRIAQEGKLTNLMSKALSPLTKRLFRGIRPDGRAMDAITMNLVANLLGLGNAATPLGIQAMREMDREQGARGCATNDMAMFVVLNTASLQLIPTTTALMRLQSGAAAPLDILPAVWGASLASAAAGAVMARVLSPVWRREGC